MKTMRQVLVAAARSVGLVSAAQAHVFVGVGIVGGPVFPVGQAVAVAPVMPVYAAPAYYGPPPLPPYAPPPVYATPVIVHYAAFNRPYGYAYWQR
jgi:hypothetical protein